MGWVAAAGLGLQALGAINSFTANKQAVSDNAQYRALQTQSTLSNYIQSLNAIQSRYAQEQEASVIQKQQMAIQNMRAKATAQASAAGAGVEGSTIDNLFQGYDRATAINNYIASKDLHYKSLQTYQEMLGFRASALSSIYNQTQYADTGVGTVLSGVGGLLSGYADMKWKESFHKKG